MEKNYTRSIFYILLFFAFIAVTAILKLTQSFIVPIVVAVLLSFVFYPFIKQMNKKAHIPWVLGIIIVVLVTLILFVVIGNLLVQSLSTVISAYPRYESRFTSLYKLFATTFKINFDEESSLITNLWNSLGVRTAVQNAAVSVSNFFVSGAKTITVITLLVIFLLIEMKTFKVKIDEAFTNDSLKRKIKIITRKTIYQVTHYISIKFLISLMTGFLVFLATFLIKMDFAIVWGFLAFILNFIPNFGSIISWLLTTLFAVLEFYPEWWKIFYIAILILAINMILGNFVEPRWEGSDLGLSPFVILVSLSIWGWMWGFVGMILAVPMMVIIKIFCENIELLNPIAILLGNSHKKK